MVYDLSRVPRTIKYKVDTTTEEIILDLRLKRFGCNRIRFRLKRLGLYLSTRMIYKILKRHCLNIIKCKIKNRKYRRFAMKHPNDMTWYKWISWDHSIYTNPVRETIS